MQYPQINPIAIQIGPIAIHWYGLAYLAGIITASLLLKNVFSKTISNKKGLYTDFIFNTFLSIIIGGRLGYVFLYDLKYFLFNPLKIMALWEGGMSFHGGLIGIAISAYIFAKQHQKKYLALTDLIALGAPIGLFFGRIANFINAELVGRPSTVPWAMVFPNHGNIPRHPSQLYEALFEGLILWIILYILSKKSLKTGTLSALFLMLYSLIRFAIEFFRAPDPQIDLLWGNLTLGQYLCIPMAIISITIIVKNSKKGSHYFCSDKN